MGHVFAVILGIVLGFFLVIAPLFADSGTALEYLLALFILDLFYFATGAVFGYILPGNRTWIGLSIPAVLLAMILYFSDEPDEFFHILVFIVFPLVAVVASLGGNMLGVMIRNRRDREKE